MLTLFIFFCLICLWGCSLGKTSDETAFLHQEADGEIINLQEYCQKPASLIVNLCLWDPLSWEQMLVLNKIREEFQDEELGIAVFIFEEPDIKNISAAKHKQNSRYHFFAADGRIVKQFGNEPIVPCVYLIDKQMKPIKTIKGYIGYDNLYRITASRIEKLKK